MDDKGFISTRRNELYERHRNKIPRTSWSAGMREFAFKKYTTLSWPTPSQEEWRRTDISGLDISSYNPFSIETAHEIQVPEGVYAVALENSIFGESSLFHDHAVPAFENIIEHTDNIFTLYNLSFLNSGYFIYIPPGFKSADTITIDYDFLGDTSLASPHTLVIASRDSAVSINISHNVNGNNVYIDGLTIIAEDNAHLSITAFQNISRASYYFSTMSTFLNRDSRLKYFEAHTGSVLTKTHSTVTLQKPGGEALINGIYFGGRNQHFDIGTIQEHRAQNTTSRAFYKGAVFSNARSVYQGLIHVTPDAPKTDAYLTNKNLILGTAARSDSIPSLKIDNNDVKCSHGSTTGKIDQMQKFYLMARGLPEADAEELIVSAFFEDIIGTVTGPVATVISSVIAERAAHVRMGESA